MFSQRKVTRKGVRRSRGFEIPDTNRGFSWQLDLKCLAENDVLFLRELTGGGSLRQKRPAVNGEFEYVPDESQVSARRGRKAKPKGDPVRAKALFGLAHVYAKIYKKATGYDYPAKNLAVIIKSLHSFPDSYTIDDLKSSMIAFMNPDESWHAKQDPPLLEVHFWQKNMTRYLPSKRPRNKSTLETVGLSPGVEPPPPQTGTDEDFETLERARTNWIRKEER